MHAIQFFHNLPTVDKQNDITAKTVDCQHDYVANIINLFTIGSTFIYHHLMLS
jgi:hypothetical protein